MKSISTGSPDVSPFSIERNSRARRDAQRGFSILEVLVAFVILAMVGTSLFGLFSAAMNNVGVAEEYSRAVLVADSVLAEASATLPLREGSQNGTADDGRIAWSTTISRYTPTSTDPDVERLSQSMVLRLWQIAAEVSYAGPNGKQRTVKLTTLRLGAKETQPQ